MTTAAVALNRIHRSVAIDDADLDRLRFVAVVGLVALNGMDLLLTRILLHHHGGAEANPLMALVILSNWGIVVKLGIPALVGARHLTAPIRRPMVLGLCWVCVLYFGVVLWNAHLLPQ